MHSEDIISERNSSNQDCHVSLGSNCFFGINSYKHVLYTGKKKVNREGRSSAYWVPTTCKALCCAEHAHLMQCDPVREH